MTRAHRIHFDYQRGNSLRAVGFAVASPGRAHTSALKQVELHCRRLADGCLWCCTQWICDEREL